MSGFKQVTTIHGECITRERAIAEQVCMTPVGCDCCHLEFRSYMVLDEVWTAAGQPAFGALLCVSCLALRLGRPLQQADFYNYPANDWMPWTGASA